MSFAGRFEELEIWQAAQDFAVEIYVILAQTARRCAAFPM
jgi:hypothetical protein